MPNRTQRRMPALALLAVVLLFPAGRLAQPAAPLLGSGITGTILDLATGRPIAGAVVLAGTGGTATDSGGRYRLVLPAGQYNLRVTADGYSGATWTGLALPPSGTVADLGLPPLHTDAVGERATAERITDRAETELAASDAPPATHLAAAVTEVPRVIRVLMSDGRIVAMDTDEYLKGVVPAEMGYVFRRGIEALKAQAIASRTYAAIRCLADSAGDPARCEPGLDANVDTTTRTQVWRPTHYDVTDEAVMATHGQVARDGAALISALFFARTNLSTLNSEASPCCGGTATRYLRAVSSPDPFRVRWGHGAGLSQEGSAVFGAWGATAEEIVEHYYTGAKVQAPGRPKLYDAGVAPRQAGPAEPITFRVGYSDPDGDAPVSHTVVIDGQARAMTGPRSVPDFRLGADYIYTTTLPAGTHALSFRFDDGFTEPVTLDAGTVTVGAGAAGNRAAAAAAAVAELPDDDPSALGTRSGRMDFGADELEPVVGATVARNADGVAPAEAGMAIVESPAWAAEFPFMAVAARWLGVLPDGAEVHITIRSSRDGVAWSDWVELAHDDVDAKEPSPDGAHWTRLLVARGRYLQARLALAAAGPNEAPPRVGGLTLHYFNSDAGPSAPMVGALAAPRVVPRAGWGADERLRFDENGTEVWPVSYTRPLAEVVHHTVTANDPADPAAVVRSVYYYHAVTREWGDIGYNFLVDHRGNVYEGRFGGERPGQIVQGGHALQYNPNTIGVSLLGTFSEVQPSAAARSALVSFLAAKATQYGLQPLAPVTLLGNRFAFSLLGHRDVLPGHTECPGNAFYPDLGPIRNDVVAEMQAGAAATATATRPPPSATPSRVPATSSPPTPVPTECGDEVVNGGFEVEDSSWIRNRAHFTAYDVYRGERSLFIGLRNDDPDSAQTYASAMQVLRLPARVGTARLTFAAKTVGQASDRRIVRLMDAQGAIIGLGSVSLPAASGWTRYDLDVTDALAGQGGREVRVYFAVVNNGDGQRSYLRLDDVALVVCAGPGSTSPTASPVASVTPTVPQPTTTAGPSATPSVVPCENLLPGGGFEAPALAGWTVSGEHPVQRVGVPSFAGGGAVALGLTSAGNDGFGYAALARDVVLPLGAVSATLSVALQPLALAPGDAVVLELRRTTDGVRQLLLGPHLADPVGRWQVHRFPLALSDLGPEIQVYLAVLNRGQAGGEGAVTAVAADELRLDVCGGRPPALGRILLPLNLGGGQNLGGGEKP